MAGDVAKGNNNGFLQILLSRSQSLSIRDLEKFGRGRRAKSYPDDVSTIEDLLYRNTVIRYASYIFVISHQHDTLSCPLVYQTTERFISVVNQKLYRYSCTVRPLIKVHLAHPATIFWKSVCWYDH
jgi:hypothetical protein